MNRLCEKLLDKCYTDITVEDIKTLINYLDEREQQQAVMIVLGMAEVPEFKEIIFTERETITMLPDTINLLTENVKAEVKTHRFEIWVPSDKWHEAKDYLEDIEFKSFDEVRQKLASNSISCTNYAKEDHSKITVKFNKTSTSWYSFSDWKRLEQRDIDPNKK